MAELPQPLLYLASLILVFMVAALGMAATSTMLLLLFKFLRRLQDHPGDHETE